MKPKKIGFNGFSHRFNKYNLSFSLITAIMAIGLLANSVFAQGQEVDSYPVGNPLGLMSEGNFEPITPGVKVYGGIYSAESCIYDAERNLIVVTNRGMPQNTRINDAWISLINHDGSVHTPRWIGVQNPNERNNLSPPLVLNDPLGSTIANGILYLADRDGGTGSDDPTFAVIRRFDMSTGKPFEDIRIEESPWINDLAVAKDGSIYATQTGDLGSTPDPQSWRIWEITPDGHISVFAMNRPINQPNGITLDPDGNIVVANYGNADVLTYSPDGELLKTESAVQPGSDGIEIMPDGTKYIGSVIHGGVSRILPGEPAVLIAQNIPSAASMCYDSEANQLVIPMTSQNSLAFIPLD